MHVEAHDVDSAEMPGWSPDGNAAMDTAEFCGVHDQRSRYLARAPVTVRIGQQLMNVVGGHRVLVVPLVLGVHRQL